MTEPAGDACGLKSKLVDMGAIPAFVSLAESESVSMQELASSALANLTGQAWPRRREAVAACLKAGGEAVLYRHLASSCAAVWREAARALLPLLSPAAAAAAAGSQRVDGGIGALYGQTIEDVGGGGGGVDDTGDDDVEYGHAAADGSWCFDGADGSESPDAMPDVLPTSHPRGGGVVALASGTWHVREWWYTGETLASVRRLVHSAYTLRMDSGGGGDDGPCGLNDGGDCGGWGAGGRDDADDGGGDERAAGEFDGFGEDDLDVFNIRGWIYPLGGVSSVNKTCYVHAPHALGRTLPCHDAN